MKKVLLLSLLIVFAISIECLAGEVKGFPKDSFFEIVYLPVGDVGKPSPNAIGKNLVGTQINKQDCIGPGVLPAGVKEGIVVGRNSVNGKQRIVQKPPPPLPPPVKPVSPPPPPPVKPVPSPPPPLKAIPPFQSVPFEPSKSNISPLGAKALDVDCEILKNHPEVKVEVLGHTDSTGSKAANKKLSEKRSESVKKYITDKCGVSPDRMNTKGYGSSKPIADNNTAEGRSKNRRVEFQTIK